MLDGLTMRRQGWRRLVGAGGWINRANHYHEASLSSSSTTTSLSTSSLYFCREASASPFDREERVGISRFANSAPGFRGILKERFTDFIVNEVDCEGKVVHLTSLDAPQEMWTVPSGNIADIQDIHHLDIEKHVEAFKAIAGEGDAALLRELLNQIAVAEMDECTPIVLASDPDKLHRTEVHNFFKTTFSFLVTDTVDGHDSTSKCIRVRLFHSDDRATRKKNQLERAKWKSQDGRDFDCRGNEKWPTQFGKHLQFHLYKENKETLEALTILGKMLGIQAKLFYIAGTKDKRGATTQRVTIFKVPASRLAALNKELHGMKVGNFSYVDNALFLGQLSGNHFTITLRGVVAESDDTIKQAADDFQRSGFINYFGLQRFGACAVPTFVIGAALLRGEWETVVNLLLEPQEGDCRQDGIAACEHFKKTRDAAEALRRIPRRFVLERILLASLKKQPNNFLQAVSNIPKTTRMLYVHSYQSFMWNQAASRRVELYGLDQVVEGDLVVCKQTENNTKGMAKVVSTEDADNLDDSIDGEGFLTNILLNVKCVSAEDAACRKFRIDDVVLPLVGSKIKLPENDVSHVIEEQLRKDNLHLHMVAHKVKEYSLQHMSGGYRPLIQRAKDFNWKVVKYADQSKLLAETDWDRLHRKAEKQALVEHDVQSHSTEMSVHSDSTTSGSCQKAVQLTFTLPPASYATMAIRELLKISSSVAFHKSLSEEMS